MTFIQSFTKLIYLLLLSVIYHLPTDLVNNVRLAASAWFCSDLSENKTACSFVVMMAEANVLENTVEYRLFPPIPEDCSHEEIRQYLEEQIEIYSAHLSSYLVGYIWQNEPFRLRQVIAENESGPDESY